ncbi:hypothetical protein CXG81DRAFT_18189 [Caulochytrium protostelioides]|uniref:Triosephosphate isomerase n=1 Tax=Caulochytrium protostelioides TaxID=1555241 RepID=A0A4P9X9S4_9FUNG|nr:hypothetical protein CXG81DRAFT_18189 [Caulochytrium protostelioides]|eukprot:RKP02078.1 hypothetical protein CXG81DRAFT_18189 [Caulochytrium protostelioides]
MARRFFVGGNWKMNGDQALVETLTTGLNSLDEGLLASRDLVVAPPFPYLTAVRTALNKHIGVAAQNLHAKASGAFTGEVSVGMLKDLDIKWAVIGHSERRSLFAEADETVAEKVGAALAGGIEAIACIGETLAEREADKTFEVLFRQMKHIAQAVSSEAAWDHVVVAYEPVWAIGTGKVATPEQAEEVHVALRKWLSEHVSAAVAAKVRIIYGGSVNAKNCGDLAKIADIDGFLVGGASLKVDDFKTICSAPRA